MTNIYTLMDFSRSEIETAVKRLDYNWFEKGNYNLNIVGIRNMDTNYQITDKFDDLLTISYKIDELWYIHKFSATTDPGKYWTENLINPNGAAILVPGQYKGAYKIGMHQGKYKALKQSKPVRVFRDDNRDECFDLDDNRIQEGIFGINIHRASSYTTSTQIGKWSAGCQVIANNKNFDKLMDLASKSSTLWGDSFTYTLITSHDIY
ncbi:hypothetical protein OAA15_00650 [bacterium]|nr:hypothetical protein [bacterium]